ncbi:MAG TPA: PAS domain-containing protein [Pseudoduganella sp.]
MADQLLSPPWLDPGDLFEHAACGLLLTDAGGAILRANRTCVAWLGYPRHELTDGMRLQDLLSIGGRVFYQTHCEPLLQLRSTVAEVQVDLVRRDGVRVPALLNIDRHLADAGALDHVAIFVASDRRACERELQRARSATDAALTARLEAEQQLRKVQRELDSVLRRREE